MRPPDIIGLTGFSSLSLAPSSKRQSTYRFLLFRILRLLALITRHNSSPLMPPCTTYICMLEGFKLFARSRSATPDEMLRFLPLFLQYLAPWHLNRVSRCHRLKKIYCDGKTANLLLWIWRANSNSTVLFLMDVILGGNYGRSLTYALFMRA